MQPPGGQEPSDPPPILLKEEGGGGMKTKTLEGRDKYGDKKGLILNTTPPIILLTYGVKEGWGRN
jgi:hypothetical protein